MWPWEGLYLYWSRKNFGSTKDMVGRNWREDVCVCVWGGSFACGQLQLQLYFISIDPYWLKQNKGAEVVMGIWDRGYRLMADECPERAELVF
jgi:hypothetical protein